MPYHNIKAYVKDCDICLSSKAICYNSYNNLQSLPILTDLKSNSYDSILIIVNRFTKMVYYTPPKVIINTTRFVEVITNMVVRHYGLFELIIGDWYLIFISMFQYSLCYFFGIKRKLSTAFYLQINRQIKKQNSIIEAHL